MIDLSILIIIGIFLTIYNFQKEAYVWSIATTLVTGVFIGILISQFDFT